MITLVSRAVGQTPSTTDLWDISRGSTVVAHSPFDAADGTTNPYDARDAFGGFFSNYRPERGNIVFDDTVPTVFTHFLEWRTVDPVSIDGIRLFAAGDAFGREFEDFTLKAKSVGSSTFDLTVFRFTPSHPYTYVDSAGLLLVAATIPTVTARDWRAEFRNRPGQAGPGPRIIELDGIQAVPEPASVALFSIGGLGAFVSLRRARRSGGLGRPSPRSTSRSTLPTRGHAVVLAVPSLSLIFDDFPSGFESGFR